MAAENITVTRIGDTAEVTSTNTLTSESETP